MNKIFKVIWSKTRNCYIVVSELAKNHDTGHTSRIRGGLLAASLMLSLSCPMYGFAALPTEYKTEDGSVYTLSSSSGDWTGTYYNSDKKEYLVVTYQNDGQYNRDAATITSMPKTYKNGKDTYTLGNFADWTGNYYDEGSNKCATVTYQGNEYNPEKVSVILTVDKSGAVDEKGNVVYGEGNNANGYGNVIYGKSNSANAGTSSDPGRAVVIGVNNTANGIAKNSTIIGQFDIVNSPNTVAIGNNIQENGSSKGGTVIIGNYAHSDSSAGGFYDTNKKYIPAGIILGEYSFSRPSANTKEAYLKPSVVSDSNKDYWNATWTPTANPVSIGDVVPNSGDDNASGGNGHGIITRQINGVAAGSYDTDAVNVAQLKQAIAKWNQGGGGTGGSSIHFYHVNSTDSSKGNYNNDGAKGTDALAAGVDAQAIGDRSTAVGNGAKAGNITQIEGTDQVTGANSTAVGNGAQALADSAVAIGDGAVANGVGATVIGKHAQATGKYATAFGGLDTYVNTASGNSSTAFGQGTQARGNASLAFGHNTIAGEEGGGGQQSVAFGEDTQALGGRSLAFGEKTVAKYNDSVAFGNDTRASSTGATAFGNRTRALAQYSTAWGNATVAADEESTAWGTDTIAGAKLDENGAVTNNYKINPKDENEQVKQEQMDVHGNLAYIQNGSTVGVKQMDIGGNTEKHDYVVLDGQDGNTYVRDYQGSLWRVKVSDDGKTAKVDTTVGENGKVYNNNSNAGTVGSRAKTTISGQEVAITPDSVLKKAHEGTNGYDIEGYKDATAFGYSTEASGDYATAFGNDTQAKATGATAFGNKSQATGRYATAWGGSSTASGEASTAFGIGSTASGKNSLAVGGAEATLEDSIALGKNSKTTRAKYSELTSDARAYGKTSTDTGKSAWEATENAIAVGNDSTTTRQITGVAAGSLDTDAVNVAQLKRLNENLSGQHTIVTVGNRSVSADNTPVTGGNLDLTRTTATNGQETYDLSLDRHVTLGEQAKDKGGSLTVNNVAYKSYDTDGNPLPDSVFGEAVKIDGKTVSVVKQDGESDQRQVVLGIDQNAGGYVALYDNTEKKPTYIFNAISSGITYLDGNNKFGRLEYGDIYNGSTQFIATLDDGLKFKGDDDKVITKKLNEQLDIVGGAQGDLTDKNIAVKSTEDGKLKVQMAKNLTDLTSVTTGNTTIDNGGLTITKKDGNKTTTVSLTDSGLDNGGNTITNVAAGTNGKDAVNVSQLNASRTTVQSSDNSISVTDSTNGKPNHAYDIKVATSTLSNETDGKVTITNPNNNTNSYATGTSVANAINNAGFTLTTSSSDGGSVSGTTTPLIKPGSTVTLDAGKNIALTQDGSKITVATKDDLDVNSVTYTTKEDNKTYTTFINGKGITITPPGVEEDKDKIILNENGLSNGGNKITNVAAGSADYDAVNMSQLNAFKTHYYSVDDTLLPVTIDGKDYSNKDNDGAKGMGSLAAGFNTYTGGIASTVAGSYSGVLNSGDVKLLGYDLRGATALSYGTLNVNKNDEKFSKFSGVANSIIGQANATTNSNAAIIYGAGNTIKNSYRDIDLTKFNLTKIISDLSNPEELAKDLRDAVPTSGGQVMVLGGGNSVDNAYMTQVNGVGNTVTGKSDEGKTYNPADSTQFNYIEGFYTNLTNGKNDYIIGAHNNVTGKSVADNQSNIVFGDNHTLTNTKNNVILGSADATDKAKTDTTTVSDVVSIGHNAKVSAEGGVAIGSGSVASTDYGSEGYDISKNSESSESTDTSATWQATKAAVSVGSTTKDSTGKVTSQETRQITNLAAGTLDTDAVNVAQLKQVKSFVDAKGLSFVGDNGSATPIAKKLNETLQIRGDGTYDKTTQKTKEDGNIQVSADTDTGTIKVALNKDINLKQNGSLTVGGQNGEAFDGSDPIVIKHFGANELTAKGTDKDGNPITSKEGKAGDYAIGLDNKEWNVNNPEYVSGRAATEDQLKTISDTVKEATTKAGKHTVVTVNDKDSSETTASVGTDGKYGAYSDSTKGNLLIAAKDDNGQTTYNIKLNDQLTIGQKGEPGKPGTPGKDGKVTVETKGGTTVVIGHDGEPGKDGKDGISVKGQDGKDGVTISAVNGKDGTNGTEGHIGLTGPVGKDGKDASADIHVKNGQNGVDGTDGNNGKDGMDRIVYEDHNGKPHEVATMDDGLKFVGNDEKEVTRKLNETLSIKGGLSKTDVANASSKNLGVRKSGDGDGLEIVMTNTPDFTKVTVGGDNKITIGGQTNSDTKNPTNGNYITGLDNTKWDKDHVTENRAATEGQLRDIAGSITNQNQGGGFALTSDEKGADKIVKQDLGKAIQIKGDTTYKADGTVEKAGNIKTSIDNGAIKVELNKDVDLTKEGSIKASETTINKDGVDTNKVKVGDITITDKGINGGAKQITNIASGISGNTYADAGDNNAASIGDVKQLAKNEAKASEAKSGKNITVKDHVVNLNDDITLGNDPKKQVAINGSNGQVVIGSGDKAMTLGKQENKAGDSNPKEGNFLNGLDNRKWDGKHIQTGRAATENQLKTVSDKVNSGRKFQGDDGKDVTVDLGKTLNIKGGATEVSDANNIGIVRGDDNTLNVRLAKDLTGLNSVTTGNTTINNGGLTIKTGDENRNITVQDGNVNMGGNQIHNVAPGQAPGDAVNVSQLNATNQTVANLGGAVNKLGTRVNRVGAGAAALAALHPLDFDPDDKWDFAAGYGNYKDASAVAVGAYYRPNEDTMFSVGGSFGGGENMVNAGVSFKVGQGNHVSTSRVAMAKEIKDLRQNIANLNAIVNRQSALIDKLTGTNAGTVSDTGNDLFPDVPANHWAYEYVTKLKQAGILTGYPDGNFDGDRMMTRYEFAAIVYRAIMAGAASNPALNQDGTLNKLAKEFSPEMKYIRIDTIAKDKNDKPTIERVRVIPDAK